MLHVSKNPSADNAVEDYLAYCVKNTFVENLRVITSGIVPQNPAELLGSGMMPIWIKGLKDSKDIDVILLDTPPSLMLSDSLVLAASVEAAVILVVEAGRTRRAAASRVRDQFQQIGHEIKGVILNGVNQRDENYYGYGYGYYNYGSDPTGTQPQNSVNGQSRRTVEPGQK
jgi:tyrosine-protein kinase Etk/Wzc